MATLRSSALHNVRTTTTRLSESTQRAASKYVHRPCTGTYAHHLNHKHKCRQGRPALPKLQRQTSSYMESGVQARLYSTQQHLENQSPSSGFIPEPIIHPIFEPTTGTFQYIVTDPPSRASVIIDPVLDFDPCTSSISTKHADSLLTLIAEKDYNVHYILETHAHADHLSAASYLQARLSNSGTRPHIGVGKRIDQVQKIFSDRYGIPSKEYSLVFDKLLEDDEILTVGEMTIKAIHLPGHTPDHMGYSIGSHVFCGDSLFATDIGTARTDFPGGSALDLWNSSQKLLSLPDDTKIWTGHDYPPMGRGPAPFMTVRQHKEGNRHVGCGRAREEFVETRKKRDEELGAPRLLHQSLQINVRGGRLPEVNEGERMLGIPLKLEGVKGW